MSPTLMAQNDPGLYKGDQALKDGFHGKAWQFYQSAYSKSAATEKTTLLKRLSLAAPKAGKKAETIVEMNKFLNSKESSKIEMSLLANLYLSKCNLELQLKLYSEAVQSCNTVLAKPEKLPESILKNALDFAVFSLTKAGELKKASELIEKHLKSFADVVIAEQQNARLKILLGEYINAISILDKYKDSKDAFTAFLRFWAYFKANETERAMTIFKGEISKLESSPDPVFTAVLIKFAESIYVKQIVESTKVLDIAYTLEKNTDTKAHIILKRAELLIKAKRDDDAIKTLNSFEKVYPKSNKILAVYLQLAELFEDKNTPETLNQAENYLSSVIDDDAKTNSQHIEALLNRGTTRLKSLKYKEAAEDFSLAASTAAVYKMPLKEISYSIYMAGLSQYINGSTNRNFELLSKSAEHFQKVIEYNAGFVEQAFTMRAVSLRKAEKWSEAVDVLEAMLTRFPNNDEAQYLLGLSRLSSGDVVNGIKTMDKFVSQKPDDPRAPQALLESLRSAIYGLDKRQSFMQSLELIEKFESYSKKSTKTENYQNISPAILHLKAILLWKQNRDEDAEKNWISFLNLYPDHLLAMEVRLWLAFKKMREIPADIDSAITFYVDALAKHKDSHLTGFTFWQFSKALHEKGSYRDSLAKIKSAENFYRKHIKEPGALRKLAAVLFFNGEVHSSMGNHSQAIIAYTEARELAADEDIKTALTGRIGDCNFSLAIKISDVEDKQDDFAKLLNKAADAYSQISKTETNSAFVKEQALYKLAKCHETAGLKGSREPQNAELAKALECYWELFFSHNDKRKQGIQTNPYYFCRTGYDLARLQLMFSEPDMRLAINTYKILADSKLPGTKEAGILAKQLTEVLNSKK